MSRHTHNSSWVEALQQKICSIGYFMLQLLLLLLLALMLHSATAVLIVVGIRQ